MEYGFTTAAYVVAAVLFILSLGGLSGQESAKRAVWYGIAGMAIAVVATMTGPGQGLWLASIVLIALGAGVVLAPFADPDRRRWRDRLPIGHPRADDADARTGRGDAQPCGPRGGFRWL
mgnify:CR=1 FL=1